MTAKKTNGDEGNGVGHNSENIDVEGATRKLVAALLPIEEQIATLRGKRTKLRLEFKSGTGIALTDFDAARRVADIQDDDERKAKVGNFMRCYSIMKPGEQIDWIEAQALTASPKPKAKPAEQPAAH